MPKNLFCDSFFTIQNILSNKIKAIIFVNIYATSFSFIHQKFAKIVCKKLEIKLQCLIKPELI